MSDNTFTVGSTPLCFTPGIYRWTQAMPNFAHRKKLWEESLPGAPAWAIDQLSLENGAVEIDQEAGNVTVRKPEDGVELKYRCRACGSTSVQAAVWKSLNGPTHEHDDGFFADDIRRPGGPGVFCPDCGAEESGVYEPGDGPENGLFPAEDPDSPHYVGCDESEG